MEKWLTEARVEQINLEEHKPEPRLSPFSLD